VVVFGEGATTKVQVLRFGQDDGVGWLCLVEGATTKVQVLRFAQDDGVGWLGLMEVVASESMIMYQAASNLFP
jgi:hypothetical protein